MKKTFEKTIAGYEWSYDALERNTWALILVFGTAVAVRHFLGL